MEGPGKKEVSDQLQFVGLWDCVCKQVRKDPEKVVITNIVSGQLGTDATWVSPDKLAEHPIDQELCTRTIVGLSTWKTGMRLAAWPRMK